VYFCRSCEVAISQAPTVSADRPVVIDGRRYIRDGKRWRVVTESGVYFVYTESYPWTCSCPAGQVRSWCRHTEAVLGLVRR
jgi:hypothetical protein